MKSSLSLWSFLGKYPLAGRAEGSFLQGKGLWVIVSGFCLLVSKATWSKTVNHTECAMLIALRDFNSGFTLG